MKRVIYALAVLAVFIPYASGQAAVSQSKPTAQDPNWPCNDPTIGLQFFPAVVVSMEHGNKQYYCPDHINAPSDIPSTFSNHQALNVVVIGINPLRQSCQVTFSDTPTPEPYASGIASALGVTVPGGSGAQDTKASTQQAAGGSQGALEGLFSVLGKEVTKALNLSTEDAAAQAAKKRCISNFQTAHNNATDVINASNVFSELVTEKVGDATAKVNAYNQLVTRANQATSTGWNDILSDANNLKMISPSAPTLNLGQDPASDLEAGGALQEYLTPNAVSILTKNKGKDFTSVATALASAANDAQKGLQAGADCKDDVQSELSKDSDELTNIYSDVKGNSMEANWKAQLASIANMSTALTSAVAAMQAKLSAPEATEIVERVADNNQSTDAVTLKCTDATTSLVAINLSGPGATGGKGTADSSPAPSGSSQKSSDSSKQAASTTETYTFKLQFGYGPRVYESAGIVFSPLQQHSYTTASPGSGPSCPLTVNGTTQTGCIVDDSASNWRVLPFVVASYRLFDIKDKTLRILTPYASFGATIKNSSSTGTSLEYLLGPSWAVAHRYLFLTVGGYAGQVTRLGGGLVPGGQSVTLPSTLPTTSGYGWGLGFAVTFKVGSQQGSSQTSNTKSTTPSKSTTNGGAGQ